MKTDAQLKKDIEAELEWDPTINAAAIGVAVTDGVATLTGHIDTYAEKYAAERALRRVEGVRLIALELDVRLAQSHRRSDTDIAIAAEQALRWNTMVPTDVRATVDKGWITLEGEVDWDFQRRSAEYAVRSLTGVLGVNNSIAIRAKPIQADEMKRRISSALSRQVERELKNISIDIDGPKVTLRGKVHSWHERDAASGVAWSSPGVKYVVNELRIG
ncbi:MAG TPA: BON domain-containing protein [Burkholderiaceae bacterium]|nr:BON domain-containing protein [Burkholderiaceae bacterium]